MTVQWNNVSGKSESRRVLRGAAGVDQFIQVVLRKILLQSKHDAFVKMGSEIDEKLAEISGESRWKLLHNNNDYLMMAMMIILPLQPLLPPPLPLPSHRRHPGEIISNSH